MNSSRGGNFRLPRDLESCILYFYGSWLTVFYEAVGLNSSIYPIQIDAHFHNSLSVNDTSAIFSVQGKSELFLPCITQASSLILIQSLKNNFSNVFLVKPIISAKSSHMTGTFFLPPTAKITMCSEDGLGEGGGREANVTFAS